MSQKGLEKQLESALLLLEASSQKIIATNGYTQEANRIKLLEELIKEQLTNANSRRTARPAR
jgi:hypothetical protein